MIIGYDARMIGHKRTGTVTMQENLLERLIKFKEHKWVLFGDKITLKKYEDYYPNVQVIHVTIKVNSLWEQFLLPFYLFHEKVDVFFSTKNYTVPFFYRHKTLCTILDIIPFKYPDVYIEGKIRKLYYDLLLYISNKSKAIVTISNFSKEDIKSRIKMNDINVIPLGPNQIFEKTRCENVKIEDTPYFLTIGGAEPRKNVQTLIQAFSLFKRNGYPHKLIIVGEPNWKEKVLSIPSDIEKHVYFKGHLDDQELYNLVKNTECFIYPSMYEGFGLPVLEALYAGVPTIVANNTSLKELFSKSSIMVETFDPISYLNAMEQIINIDYSRDSYDVVINEYNWENSAHELMEILKKHFGR